MRMGRMARRMGYTFAFLVVQQGCDGLVGWMDTQLTLGLVPCWDMGMIAWMDGWMEHTCAFVLDPHFRYCDFLMVIMIGKGVDVWKE